MSPSLQPAGGFFGFSLFFGCHIHLSRCRMNMPSKCPSVVRRGYIRAAPSHPYSLGDSYQSWTPLPKFLEDYIVASSKPGLQYIYLLGLISPEDDQVLEWLIDQSRPLSDEELERRGHRTCWNNRALRRGDFVVYLTRDRAKSDSGKGTLKRLAAESVAYHVLSPADIQDALQSMPGATQVDGAESLERSLDEYLLLKSDYLINQTTMVYSKWASVPHQQLTWWQSVRDGELGIPEDPVDYSVVRLRERGAGRIMRRCDCSGMHPRCPRPTDSGPQWRCSCGGRCKRRGACREGQRRTKDEGSAVANMPWVISPGIGGGREGDAIKHGTAEEMCRRLSFCVERRGDAQWLDCAKAWTSIDNFSGDWKTE